MSIRWEDLLPVAALQANLGRVQDRGHGHFAMWVGPLWPVAHTQHTSSTVHQRFERVPYWRANYLHHTTNTSRGVYGTDQPATAWPNAGRVVSTSMSTPKADLLNELRNILSAVSTAACVPGVRTRARYG